MYKSVVIGCFACTPICLAQGPYVAAYWEGNDGSGWTRNSLVTTNSIVQVRLTVEWGATDGVGLAGMRFDALLNNALAADNVTGISRLGNFQFLAQTIVASHFPNALKIDDSHDTQAAGTGPNWIMAEQAPDVGGLGFDRSSAPSIFGFNLNFQNTFGTRNVMLIPGHYSTGESAMIWTAGSQIRVNALFSDLAITYIPNPTTVSLAFCAGFGAYISRRRRTI